MQEEKNLAGIRMEIKYYILAFLIAILDVLGFLVIVYMIESNFEIRYHFAMGIYLLMLVINSIALTVLLKGDDIDRSINGN